MFQKIPGEYIHGPRGNRYPHKGTSVDPVRWVRVEFQCGHHKDVRESKSPKLMFTTALKVALKYQDAQDVHTMCRSISNITTTVQLVS